MTSEAEELSKVIADIYDAAIDPSLWTRALGNACLFVGGSSAALVWHDAAKERSEALHMFNDDPYYTQLYFEKYLPMDPHFPAATFMEPGIVHSATDFVPQDELAKTRFFREWIKPQGIVDAIGANLEKGVMRSLMLNIRMDKTYGFVDDAARDRASLLVPHFQRAVAIGQLFDQNRAAEAVLTETLHHIEEGVFLLSVKGRIVFVNTAGRNILDEGKLLREERECIAAVVPDANRMLQDIFTATKKGDTSIEARGIAVPLSASPADRWFAHVLPLTSGTRQQTGKTYSAIAALFVRKISLENPTALEVLAKLYGLTASEIRVFDAVLKLGSVKAIAEMLGVSQATVRSHLHKLFQKTQTHRQSDLVKLIAHV